MTCDIKMCSRCGNRACNKNKIYWNQAQGAPDIYKPATWNLFVLIGSKGGKTSVYGVSRREYCSQNYFSTIANNMGLDFLEVVGVYSVTSEWKPRLSSKFSCAIIDIDDTNNKGRDYNE